MNGAFGLGKLRQYGELVKFEHTVFALPFALSAFLLAETQTWPSLGTLLWVILAMVGGRTFAMGLNRIIDCRIDGMNPRTCHRTLPAGRIALAEAWALTLAALILMGVATWQLPLLCRQLLPIAIGILAVYSYVKRFSDLCHLVLGVALGASAVGGWIARTGYLEPAAILFGLAVTTWVAGFDILYACQDVTFDRDQGLYSLPASWGIDTALWLSRGCHLITVLLLAGVGWLLPQAGLFYGLGVLLVLGMLVYEHTLVSPTDLSRLNEAFFRVNGLISLGFFLCVLLEHAF